MYQSKTCQIEKQILRLIPFQIVLILTVLRYLMLVQVYDFLLFDKVEKEPNVGLVHLI